MQNKKKALRREMKSRLALLPAEYFREAGLKAASLITLSPIWKLYKTLLLFMSIDNEINTLPLLEVGLKDKKKVFLPRVEEGTQNRIRFYKIEPQHDLLQQCSGSQSCVSYGIPEPFPINPLMDADFPALILTPGLAFDRNGNRLGRGAGFYDRFFEELKDREYLAAGLCLETQILPVIPVNERDKKVACVCTELEIFSILF